MTTQNRTIVIIGMMGVGKSTVGRRLANRLDLPFFDADQEIEKAAGMSVSELFKMHGEPSFRNGEARVIERLLNGPPHVLATGGGAILDASTRALIIERSLSIWLRASTDTIVTRAKRRDTRPLLQTDDPKSVLEKLFLDRREFYEIADIHIESQPGPHTNTVTHILEALDVFDPSMIPYCPEAAS